MIDIVHLIRDVVRYLYGDQELKHLMVAARSRGPELVMLPREHPVRQLYAELEGLVAEKAVGALSEGEFRETLKQKLVELAFKTFKFADAVDDTQVANAKSFDGETSEITDGATNLSFVVDHSHFVHGVGEGSPNTRAGAVVKPLLIHFPFVPSTEPPTSSSSESQDPESVPVLSGA